VQRESLRAAADVDRWAVRRIAESAIKEKITAKLKPDVQIIKKGGLCYLVESSNRLLRFKPWLGDSFKATKQS
jgi:hypothetical protein